MRIYIISNDGITLSREPPAAVSEGEIVVASSEELHAAPLNGRRLMAEGDSVIANDVDAHGWGLRLASAQCRR